MSASYLYMHMNIHTDGFHCMSADMNDLAIAAIDAFARISATQARTCD